MTRKKLLTELELGMQLSKLSVLLGLAASVASPLYADDLIVMNSFSDPALTGGNEMAFMRAQVGADEPLVLAMYTVTVSDGEIEFELTDNTAASDLVFPDGRQDIWYISLEGATNLRLSDASDANYNLTSEELAPGSSATFDGAFREDLDLEVTLAAGGIRIALGGGTDLNEIGTSWIIEYDP
jgi:hypothetical protein